MVEVWFATCLLRSMIKAIASGLICCLDGVEVSKRFVDMVCGSFELEFIGDEASGELWSCLVTADNREQAHSCLSADILYNSCA